jgi:hypothetical protein
MMQHIIGTANQRPGERVPPGRRGHAVAIGFALSEVAHTPEQHLMAAVLQDAISCYIRHVGPSDRSHRRLHDDAARWIGNRDTEWPYSFENICSVLGLDAATIRRELRVRCFGRERGDQQLAPGAAGLRRCAA